MSENNSFIIHAFCTYFLPAGGLSFHSFGSVFHRAEIFNFREIQLVSFLFMNHPLVNFRRASHTPRPAAARSVGGTGRPLRAGAQNFPSSRSERLRQNPSQLGSGQMVSQRSQKNVMLRLVSKWPPPRQEEGAARGEHLAKVLKVGSTEVWGPR